MVNCHIMYQIDEHDDSEVGTAYTRLQELELSESATLYDVSVAKLIFALYHTVTVGDDLYALDEGGVLEDGTIYCCQWCAAGVKAKAAKMEFLSDKADRQPDFTPRATACHKPPESQPVSPIASLLVIQFASQPIYRPANLPASQFVARLSASQPIC